MDPPPGAGEPPAWITGTVRFCGRTMWVAPGVYVPRVQTEELARRAAQLLPAKGRAVDLCTGRCGRRRSAAPPAGRLVAGRGRGDQDQALIPDVSANGFDLVEPWPDDDGDLRYIAAQTLR